MPISFKNQTIKNKENIMKKTLLAILSIAIAFTAMQPSQAQDQKVLAIIDTAINAKNFPSIIHEVCFTTVKSSIPTQNMSCPNGELFMEGPGAAAAPWPASINNGTYHGDSMVKAALVTNPDVKIVFVRFADVTSLGNHRGDPNALIAAIDWVSKNASKYSIDALSISQSGVSTDLKTRDRVLHPACSDARTATAVAQLKNINVPTFAATGNDGLSNLVGFPACITDVIGVGAMGSPTQLEKATNRGPGLDMVALGKVTVTKYNGSVTDISGSSAATVVSASSYINKNTGRTFTDYINSLVKINISGVSYPYSSK
jgi:subtilisin